MRQSGKNTNNCSPPKRRANCACFQLHHEEMSSVLNISEGDVIPSCYLEVWRALKTCLGDLFTGTTCKAGLKPSFYDESMMRRAIIRKGIHKAGAIWVLETDSLE